jgi:hypothetical protein
LERSRPRLWFQLTVASPFFSLASRRFLQAELLREAGRFDEAAGWYGSIAERTPPSQRRVEVPGTRSWPFALAVTRAGTGDGKPLVTLRGRLFDSGIIDGLVADAGVVTVAAYLRDLRMHEVPACPAPN